MENRTTPLQVLQKHSRTFYIPIVRLPPKVQQTVAAVYLCMRGIDEVEDHISLENDVKAKILRNIAFAAQRFNPDMKIEDMKINFEGRQNDLPEVSLRLAEWIFYSYESFRGRMADFTATMADRMAIWAQRGWRIDSVEDLDTYTFAIAGAVGLITCEIWEWFEGSKTDRTDTIAYMRGLHGVNFLRGQVDDAKRGVSFFPPGWTQKDMIQYSRKNLKYGERYINSLKENSAAKIFSEIPYFLAVATLDSIERGIPKLTRQQVAEICKISA